MPRKDPQGSADTFVTLLQRYRKAAGLTQTDLAGKLKVVPSTVSYWESGVTLPHPRMIPKIARLLGIKPIELTRLLEPELEVSAAK